MQTGPFVVPKLPIPTRRIVLLGASNLVRGCSVIVETARSMYNEPIDFMIAMGHGRSYGRETSVFGRKISGIFSSRLWDELQSRAPLPTCALMTDIGNDIVYEIPFETLFEWVGGCLSHLEDAHAKTLVTKLPIESIQALSEFRFRLFRMLLFPKSALTFEEAQQRVKTVQIMLEEACKQRKTPCIPVDSAWYGLDPIHLKKRCLTRAWPQILSKWQPNCDNKIAPRRSPFAWLSLVTKVPQERTLWGFSQQRTQPSKRFKDGTTISFY